MFQILINKARLHCHRFTLHFIVHFQWIFVCVKLWKSTKNSSTSSLFFFIRIPLIVACKMNAKKVNVLKCNTMLNGCHNMTPPSLYTQRDGPQSQMHSVLNIFDVFQFTQISYRKSGKKNETTINQRRKKIPISKVKRINN